MAGEGLCILEEWYRRYGPWLFSYARQIVSYHIAEELVQETFRVAWEHGGNLADIRYPKAWLRKILDNCLRNKLREISRLHALIEQLQQTQSEHYEDPVNIELEYEGAVSSDDLRLLKRLAEGHTYQEAADELQISAEACRKRVKRAEEKLKKVLEIC